nr:unnamed protein product [Digitaria exilis]
MEAAAPPPPLPLLPDFNPGVRRFLDARFRSAADLATAADVEAEICGRCTELEALVSDLSVRILEAATAYSSCREASGSALRGVGDGLRALKASISTGVGEEDEGETEHMQFEQLPALASEVARMEMVGEYAEMALKLDSLVGDVEDAVSSVTGKLKSVGNNSEARVSWLSLVDLMISFDKRTQDLMSDWLEVWAEIERQETLDKLKSAMESEKNWIARIEGAMVEYESDDFKSPAITTAVQQSLSLLIDRARPIPSVTLRAEFIRLPASPIISEFLGYMLRRCQEAEGLTALADDSTLLKVSQSINAARYFESTLTEWCEDVFFIEMENSSANGEGGCIFEEEINHVKEFRVEWVDKITTVILRAFDSRSRDYLKNKRQWLEKSDGPAVSRAFVECLDYMQGQLSKLEAGLNPRDFVTVWRSVASGVDQLLFACILAGGTKISSGGVERLEGDLSILFAVFSAWCIRPEGFFPKLSEGLRLLKVDKQQLRDGVSTDESWLRQHASAWGARQKRRRCLQRISLPIRDSPAAAPSRAGDAGREVHAGEGREREDNTDELAVELPNPPVATGIERKIEVPMAKSPTKSLAEQSRGPPYLAVPPLTSPPLPCNNRGRKGKNKKRN